MHQIKIDRSFIADIDGRSRSVIEGAALIARRFGLQIVVRVSRPRSRRRRMLSLGIDSFQGYLVVRPVAQPQMTVNCPWLEGGTASGWLTYARCAARGPARNAVPSMQHAAMVRRTGFETVEPARNQRIRHARQHARP